MKAMENERREETRRASIDCYVLLKERLGMLPPASAAMALAGAVASIQVDAMAPLPSLAASIYVSSFQRVTDDLRAAMLAEDGAKKAAQ